MSDEVDSGSQFNNTLLDATVMEVVEEGEPIMGQDDAYLSVNNKMADLALQETASDFQNNPPPYLEHLKEVYGEEEILNILALLRDVDRLREKVDFNTSGLEDAIKRLNELITTVNESKLKYKQNGENQTNSQAQTSSTSVAENEHSTIPFKVVDEAVTVLSNEILLMQSTVEAHKMQNARERESYEKKLKDIQSKIVQQRQRMRTDGKIFWRIDNYKETLDLQRTTLDPDKMSIISPHFQTPTGHEFRLRAFLNGTGRGRGTHLSMFIQMCRTQFDDILDYPYTGVIVFRVFDQVNRLEKKHHKLMFKTNNSPCFKKPEVGVEFTPENGLAQLLSHQIINKRPSSPDDPVFLKDDVLFVGAEIIHQPNGG